MTETRIADDLIKELLPMAEEWIKRNFDFICDHEDGDCSCSEEARCLDVVYRAKRFLGLEVKP